MRRLCCSSSGIFPAVQKRKVATTCRRLVRSSRYNATMPAETIPASPSNSPKLRFRKFMAYAIAPARTIGPKIASSIGIEVDNPTYRPPLRSATLRSCSAKSSKAVV